MERYYRDPEFRDRLITLAHQRRADKLGIPGVVNTPTLIAYLMKRDQGVCGICGGQVLDDGSPDHIIPLNPRPGEPQGAHSEENLQLAHLSCNLRKSNKQLAALSA